MRTIIGSSLTFRWLVIFASVALLYFGAAEVRSTPVDVFPEFAPPRVEIQTPTVGLSPLEVEEFVTVPLEQNLAGVQNVDTIRSTSVEQLSSITLLFERGTDTLAARQVVQERLAAVSSTLPSWSAPPFMMQPLSSTSRTLKIGVSSDRYSLIELSSIVRNKIRPRLLRVPGVANVGVWGNRKEVRMVLLDPQRMAAHGVSVPQIMRVTADALDAVLLTHSPGSVIGTGGFVDTPNQRIGVRHVAPILAPMDLSRVVFDAP